ncbi:MAG: bifunctional riboflavin kinase/FAD synthetase [Pseudomonadota bacterium]
MTELHTSTDNIPAEAQNCVLMIGNFDGIHLGHRALIGKARDLAAEARAPLGIITFEPHPLRFFQPESEPFRLTLLPMKKRLLEGLGVNHLFVVEFNRKFSLMDGNEFIESLLTQRLKAMHLVVGGDFAFGREKSGTIKDLEGAAADGKFGLSIVKPVLSAQGKPCSSTVIRKLLRKGSLRDAEKLLGWPWQIEASIVPGDRRGHSLGYPTANQNIPEYVRIPYGVYAVRVKIEGESLWRDGVANFGIRPMFKTPQPIFETFIFDFTLDIYGKIMRVQPVRYLRPELSFRGIDSLIAQMKEDCIAAKAVLKSS